jgi:hypothetical protein
MGKQREPPGGAMRISARGRQCSTSYPNRQSREWRPLRPIATTAVGKVAFGMIVVTSSEEPFLRE